MSSKWKPPAPTATIPWDEISKIRIEEYETGKLSIDDLEGWIDTAALFRVDPSDDHFQDATHTSQVLRLMRILLARVDFDANKAYTDKENSLQKLTVNAEKISILEAQLKRSKEERDDAHTNFIDVETACDALKEEKDRLMKDLRHAQKEIKRGEDDLTAAQKEAESARKDTRRIQKEIDDLQRISTSNARDFSKTEQSNAQLLAEHQHLLGKYRAASDGLKSSEHALAELQTSSQTIQTSLEGEISQLRSHIHSLQQDNTDLVQSRDKAEAQLERREAEALQDLQEMQQLQQAQIEEERVRYHSLRDQFVQLKTDYDILRLQGEATITPQEVREKDTLITRLTKEVEALKESGYSGNDDMPTTSGGGGRHAAVAATDAMVNKLLQQKTKLESDNDQLQNEVRGLELRLDAQDSENLRLAKEIKEYEMGDEGLRRLRHDLQDMHRVNVTLSDESAQLRERLGNMEDNVSLCTALKEVCLRMGVTQQEIDKLHSGGFANHNELETLRQEVRALKEEVDWVERERKHWMRKVRLQPLLDTKLRFELGLTQEQLKQLDGIVEQMKSGGVVVDDGDYRDKYYEEVRLRQREVKSFNDEIRNRIETILGTFVATGGRGGDSNMASELRRLHEQASGASQSAQQNLNLSEEARGAAAQASALERKLYQHELTDQDQVTVLTRLRDQVARLEAEMEVTRRERDTYRTAVLELARAGAEVGPSNNHNGGGDFDDASGFSEIGLVEDGPSAPSSVHPDTSIDGADSHLDGDAEGMAAISALMGMGRRRPSHQPRCSAQDGGRLVELLKQQLLTKDELVKRLERNLRQAEEDAIGTVDALTDARRSLDTEKQRSIMLMEQAEAASKAADEAECKVEQLERLRGDLENLCNRQMPPQSGELLQKIISLRQREGRMSERLRAFMRKEDALQKQCDEQQKRIVELLQPIKDFLATTNPTDEATPHSFSAPSARTLYSVLPTTQGATAMERQVLSEMQETLAKLGRGEVLEEDMAFIKEAQRLYAGLHSSNSAQATSRALLAARREIANLKHLVNEERILRKHVEATAGGGGDSPQDADSTADHQSTTLGKDAKVALVESRLEAKIAEVGHLEAALHEAEERCTSLQSDLTKAKSTNNHGDDEGAPMPTSKMNASMLSGGKGAAVVHRLEGELAKYKSMNLGLVVGAIDDASARSSLQIQLKAKEKEVILLKESGLGHRLSEFVTSALADNTALQQQVSMSEHMVKRMRLQVVTSEANFRVASNEAASYKASAYRLYRSYVEHVRQIIETVRRVQRQCEGAMTPREVVILQGKISGLEDRGADAEQRIAQLAGEDAVKDEVIRLLTTEAAVLKTEHPAEASSKIRQFNADNVAQLRQLKRTIGEMKADLQHEQGKLQAAHAYEAEMASELSRLEVGSGFLALDGDFAAKMEQLYETVFNKANEAPSASGINASTGGGGQGGMMSSALNLSSGSVGDEAMLRTYRDAIHQQASLSKQVTTLQHELGDVKKQLASSEDAKAMLKQELARAEGRCHEATASLEQDRSQAKTREERLAQAHTSQRDLLENAMNHNIRCLKDIITNKEKALERATEQLGAERQRYLEHQLLDTTRIERLHDQLFRENSAMVEKFKASLSSAGSPLENVGVQPPPTNGNMEGMPGPMNAHVQQLTTEIMALRNEVKELRHRNITLESTHNDRMAAHQRQLREMALDGQVQRHSKSLGDSHGQHGGGASHLPPVESTLYDLTQEQSVALDGMRKKEADLVAEVGREREENMRLRNLLSQNDRNQAVADHNSPLHSRLSPALVQGLMASSGAESVADLRAYISTLEAQLREVQAQVAESRYREAETISTFRKQLADTKADVEGQTVHVSRTNDLSRKNDDLRRDLRNIKGQHDKMVSAVALLKQELIKQQTSSNEADAGRKQDLAITHRMGALQAESAQSIEQMQQRLESVQKEVSSRVDKEEELLGKAKKAQATALAQLEELEGKDATIRSLRAEIDRLKLRYRDTARRGPMPSTPGSKRPASPPSASIKQPVSGTTKTDSTPSDAAPQQQLSPPALPPGFIAAGVVQLEKACQTVELRTVSIDSSPPQPAAATSRRTSSLSSVAAVVPTSTDVATTSTPPTVMSTSTHIGVRSSPITSDMGVQVDAPRTASPTTARVSSSSARRMPMRKSSPPKQPVKLGVPNDLVVRLRKEHEAELAKYNQTIHRLEHQLNESESHLKREKLAWEVKKEKYEARIASDRTKLKLMDGTPAPTGATNQPRSTSPKSPTTSTGSTGVVLSPSTPASTVGGGAVVGQSVTAGPILAVAATQTPTVSIVAVSPNTSGTQASLYGRAPTRTSPPKAAAAHRDVNDANERELVAASADLRLHTALRRQRTEIEVLTKRMREAETVTLDLRSQLDNAQLNTQPHRVPLQVRLGATTTPTPKDATKENKEEDTAVVSVDLAYIPSCFDVRRFKSEVMRLESTIDDLNREIQVVKEAEIRRIGAENTKLEGRVRELEVLLATARGSIKGGGCSCTCRQDIQAKEQQLSTLENRLLTQEGSLLDLRFERELAILKQQRLNKHIQEVMAVDGLTQATSSMHTTSRPTTNGGRSPPRPGTSPSGRNPAQQGTNLLRSKQRDIANLEAVVDGLRNVLERAQHENLQLRATAVPVSQYNACQREIAALRAREKDLVAYLQDMGMKQRNNNNNATNSEPSPNGGNTVADNDESLNTRRLRMAQQTALGYQAELADLRNKVGLPLSPPPRESSQRPSTAQQQPPPPAQGGTNPNPQRVLNLSPYAPEHHATDHHHHWAH